MHSSVHKQTAASPLQDFFPSKILVALIVFYIELETSEWNVVYDFIS